MIEQGSDINIEDKYGHNFIFYSIRKGHYKVTELLIKNETNLNQIDKKKMTPYTFAEKFNQGKIADLLVEHGAINQSQKAKRKRRMSIEEIQKPKKFILVRIDSEGRKIPLSEEELSQFKEQNKELYTYLENKESRNHLTENANKELL